MIIFYQSFDINQMMYQGVIGFEATKKATALVILYRIAGDDPFCPPQIRKDDNRVDSIVVFYKGGELFRAFGTAVSA